MITNNARNEELFRVNALYRETLSNKDTSGNPCSLTVLCIKQTYALKLTLVVLKYWRIQWLNALGKKTDYIDQYSLFYIT